MNAACRSPRRGATAKTALGLLLAGCLATSVRAQVSGNAAYGLQGGKARAEQAERNQRTLTPQDLPPTATSMFVDADVLVNVKADEFVAVFSLAQEGTTVEEASQKLAATLEQFTAALKPLHVRDTDLFVDMIADPKIYGYDIADNVAREKLTGFELKKNVAIHFSDSGLLDQLVATAARFQIYDLIKVDYIVKDTAAVEARLRAEAAAIIHDKSAQYDKLLGIHVENPGQVYADRSAIYYPTQMYDSYTAAEAETVNRPANLSKFTVQNARRSRTFYFNGLDGNGFDKVINPVITEPVVQFTLYLKVKYEIAR